MLNYEDILEEVKVIRKILGNTPNPIDFDGTARDDVAGKVLETLADYGKFESVCYISYQLACNLEDRIRSTIEERDEADRRWREKYASEFMDTVKDGPEGEAK